MANDDMMAGGGGGGGKNVKDSLSGFQCSFFSVIFYEPLIGVCLVLPKEGIVTLRVARLVVRGCKGPSTMVRSPTYAVSSRFMHIWGGGGGKK